MKSLKKRSAQAGFTMIELIVVIVILGVLAATALPKFFDLGSEARAAALQGVVGASNSAMSLNFGSCAIANHAPGAKCIKVANCTDVKDVLQGGVPNGYTVTAAAIGAGTAGSNGVNVTCTVTQTGTPGAAGTATFTGISAGNGA
jgi:MSHA pilin protein MshA